MKSMIFSASSLLLASFFGATYASPIDAAMAMARADAGNARRAELIVPISNCTTIKSGKLYTTNGHPLNLVNGKLSFSKTALSVQFQSCQPNFGHFDGQGNTPTGGHIYVPSAKKCIATQYSTKPPLTFGLDKCYFSDDSGQVSQQFVQQKDKKVYFVGGTQADGSETFYNCKSGFYGVKSSPTTGVAKFDCINKGHIVGLNVK